MRAGKTRSDSGTISSSDASMPRGCAPLSSRTGSGVKTGLRARRPAYWICLRSSWFMDNDGMSPERCWCATAKANSNPCGIERRLFRINATESPIPVKEGLVWRIRIPTTAQEEAMDLQLIAGLHVQGVVITLFRLRPAALYSQPVRKSRRPPRVWRALLPTYARISPSASGGLLR